MESAAEYAARRASLNDKVLSQADLSIKRFFALDHDVYSAGALSKSTKELIGLVASTVLRCDDCITYHVIRCKELGATNGQLMEIFNVGLIVGGSIVIPHLRRAVALLDELDNEAP